MEFQAFGKIARLHRDIIVTEKIDGTNAAVVIERSPGGPELPGGSFVEVSTDEGEYAVGAQSRNRLITPDKDNFGFAKWVYDNAIELVIGLGEGRHFGEWWGAGIQRGYGLVNTDKRFSLFNTERWENNPDRPDCVGTVPVLAKSDAFDQWTILEAIEQLEEAGSVAAPGFNNPEGIVVFHVAANQAFKYTIGNDGHKESR